MSADQVDLEGRIALVTGGSRGIGRQIARDLARRGADVAISYRSQKAEAQACVKEIEECGRRGFAQQAAVENYADDRALVEATARQLGPIDMLICNAGIDWDGTAVIETDPDPVEHMMRVNAIGPHHLCKLVLPPMRERPRGDIVIISSCATEYLNPGFAPYNMSKAAVEALAFTLAKEEQPHGIHVNVIAPGLVETPMGRTWAESEGTTDMRELDAQMPFGHVCQPSEIADVVCFLVSEGASYVTGQRIYVHGGAVITPG